MLLLTIRTDKPEAEIGLYENNKQVAYKTWQAHRQLAETIYQQIAKLLQSLEKDWRDIGGIVCFKGPGSFTGLRIGLTVANALAYGLDIPVVSDMGDNWIKNGIKRIQNKENESIAMPDYGAPVHITLLRK